jgi:hypothetical protein
MLSGILRKYIPREKSSYVWSDYLFKTDILITGTNSLYCPSLELEMKMSDNRETLITFTKPMKYIKSRTTEKRKK